MDPWDIDIENVAGIRSGAATIRPGVNTIRAENWQGKSSFLSAIETVMGTDRSLTEGQESGSVRLEAGEDTYHVELTRVDGDVRTGGTPFLDEEYDRVCADLYAFMDAANDVRVAVRRGENLESVLTRPLDFENLDERIAALRSEREQVAVALERAREAAEQLSTAQSTVTGLERDLESLRERRAELAGEGAGDEADDAHDRLSDARAERDQVETRIERLEGSVERAEEELDERRSELEALDVPELDDVSTELAREREALAAVELDVELLESVYGAADHLLDEERFDLLAEVEHGLVDDTVTCLLCGNDVGRSEFADHLEAVGERVAERREVAAAHRDRIEELEAERAAVERGRRRRADLEDRIAELEATVGERRESLASARETLAELEERVESLSEAAETFDSELTDVDSDIKYAEAELEDARDELESLADRAASRERLERERDELAADIEELRNRKDRMKRRAREAFDEAMGDILAEFDTGFETARLTSGFDLVVAREGREASLDALSEGELELIGLVAAIAGHEAFEVADVVPLLLLDDLGGLSNDSIHTVVDLLRDRVERLVLTAYPENTTFEGNEIDPADWSVVSDPSEIGVRT